MLSIDKLSLAVLRKLLSLALFLWALNLKALADCLELAVNVIEVIAVDLPTFSDDFRYFFVDFNIEFFDIYPNSS